MMKSIVLFITAVLLLALLLPFAVVCSFVMLFVNDSRKRNSGIRSLFYALALAVDVAGNVICADLFNLCLIRHGGYGFGRVGETVSSVLGKNLIKNKLTGVGKRLVLLLDFFDKNHCLKWVDDRFNDDQLNDHNEKYNYMHVADNRAELLN